MNAGVIVVAFLAGMVTGGLISAWIMLLVALANVRHTFVQRPPQRPAAPPATDGPA